MDLYEFVDESEGRTAANFDDSFMEAFREDSDSENSFDGFGSEDVNLGDRVHSFHTRTDEEVFGGKENIPPSTFKPRKRKCNPER